MLSFDLLYNNLTNMISIDLSKPHTMNGVQYAIIRAKACDKVALYDLHFFLKNKAFCNYTKNRYSVYILADFTKIIIIK